MKWTNHLEKVFINGRTESLMKVSGLMVFLKEKELRNYLMAQCLMECGKKAYLRALGSASIQMKVVMMVIGKKASHMEWARRNFLTELLLTVDGSKAKHEDTE